MIMTMDIGGTKTLCAFWENGRLLDQEKFATQSISDFTRFLSEYTAGKKIDSLCAAIAAPVTAAMAELTNTGQRICPAELKKALPHIPHIDLLNDLEALGYSLSALKGEQLRLFRPGAAAKGSRAAVSIGTGLGISAVTGNGIVLPSEGGHMDFAPLDRCQQELFSTLRERYDHVSYERVLSGQGIENIYEALTGRRQQAQRITELAFSGDFSAGETFRIFTQILGAACGNYGLLFLATGGIYLGGGIMPKILPLIDREIFEAAYLDKGRNRKLLQQIPIYVILDELAPSQGAAIYAARSAMTV